jgi:hypothetical protein
MDCDHRPTYFAGSYLERRAQEREDPQWIAAARADPPIRYLIGQGKAPPRRTALVGGYVGRQLSHLSQGKVLGDLIAEPSQTIEVTDTTGGPWVEIDYEGDRARAGRVSFPELRLLPGMST